MSYYQKYRPRKVSDLNLYSVRDSFEAVLKSGKVSHAYLFVGPRGSGKTSAARILSQVVNCELNKDKSDNLVDPCGVCASCLSLNKGGAVDVIEIDAASNGLVEDIRDLREKVRLAPATLRKKVYIIDEVHMVSTAGFNALLKTLEEPPTHAMFILCTTEAHKVPETIVSRCTKIGFYKASELEMIDSLKRVIAGESLVVADSALPVLATMSDGSFREAHKLLEQLAGFGVEITDNLILEKLGGASKVLIKMAVESALSHEPAKVLEVFEELERNSSKAQIVLTMLIGYLKQQLEIAVKSGANIKDILKMLDGLIVSSEKIKVSPEPLLPLELVLLEISLGNSGERASVKPAESSTTKVEEKQNAADNKLKDSAVIKPEIELVAQEEKKVDKVVSVEIREEINTSLEKIKLEWSEFLNSFAESNGSLAGMLRNSNPMDLQGKSLVLEVRSRFQKDMLERDVKKKLIEEEMEKVWGPINLKMVLQEAEARTEPNADDANVTSANVDVEKIFG